MIKEFHFASCFAASASIHLVVLLLVSSFMTHQRNFSRQEFIPVLLLPVAERETPAPQRERPMVKRKWGAAARPTPSRPATLAKKETDKSVEIKAPPPKVEELPPLPNIEVGGSAAGTSNSIGVADIGIMPGSGTGGGGGTAPAGLGRGSGASGFPAQQTILRTNREAKHIQTARAVYPPMALRAGLESDVTLRIEVSADGKVTNAEIIKSGGAGFDEEALKAVKESRFEPAQREGQNVVGEFTFIYRFRLRR